MCTCCGVESATPNYVTVNGYQLIAHIDDVVTKRTILTLIYDQTRGRRQIKKVFDSKPKRTALHSVFVNAIILLWVVTLGST